MKKYLLLVLCLCGGPAAAQSERSLTLDEAFRLALETSEALAIDEQGIKQLEALEAQRRATFRPEIYGLASQTAAQGAPGRAQAALNLSYNLFSGLRDYLAAKAAGARTDAARLQLARARQALYLDVASAYADLSARRRQIAVRSAQLEVAAGRIKELEGRAAIGRSRQSEVVAARAQLAQDEASLAAELSGENSAQLAMSFLTGLEGPLDPAGPPVAGLEPLEPYLAAARSRADVAAARQELKAAQAEARVRGRLGLPSLDLSANYYLKRPAPNESDRWDAGLTLSVPLYTGGYNAAAENQYSAQALAAASAAARAERAAVTEVRQAYSALEHSLAVIRSLQKALALAEENARLQAKDYTYGLVTNLDVLNSQNAVLQTALNLEAAAAGAAMAQARLEAAAGRAGETK
ncbi:MAG: TolC family protein [Elusimicrobiales bacterium]|nr:TolC family protein [Elusimicrobiales bacterium]